MNRGHWCKTKHLKLFRATFFLFSSGFKQYFYKESQKSKLIYNGQKFINLFCNPYKVNTNYSFGAIQIHVQDYI